VITKKEEMENSGEYAIVKILEARMKSVMGMLRRELNKQVLANTSTVLTSLNTLNGSSAGGTGFLEPRATASQTNIIGGISKVTFPVAGWLNQFSNGAVTTDFMTNLYNMYIAANAVSPMGDVDHVIFSQAALARYRKELFDIQRFIDTKTLDGGRMGLAFNGALAESDPVMGFNTGVVGETLDAYMLNYDGIKLVFHSEGDFSISPFEHISGTTARSANLYVKCQLVADFLGGQAVGVNLQ
jgi:hypothetical protein